jgi:hypothetical protein
MPYQHQSSRTYTANAPSSSTAWKTMVHSNKDRFDNQNLSDDFYISNHDETYDQTPRDRGDNMDDDYYNSEKNDKGDGGGCSDMDCSL